MESVWSWPTAARVSSRLPGGELTVEYPRFQWSEDSQVRRLDEINIGPKKDFRLPSPRWIIVAAATGLVALTATLIAASGGSRHVPRPRGPSTVAAAPTPSPTAAPGTFLLTCDSATWGQLESNWRAQSVRAGPLWFVGARQSGYVHYSSSRGSRRTVARQGKHR